MYPVAYVRSSTVPVMHICESIVGVASRICRYEVF